jgi:site-specific DNA recombinase
VNQPDLRKCFKGLSVVLGSKRLSRKRERSQAKAAVRAEASTKAIGYLRVSTEEQATTGHGLESQDRAVRAFAESQGYELVEVVTDAGVSGATKPAERAGFARVLELASQQAAAILLVYKFDRLAREIRYAVTTASDLAEQHHVAIRSVTEPIDTATPMGRTLFAILAGMAENERFAIRDRTAGGRVTKAMKGSSFVGGRVPYGFRRDANGELEPSPAEARIIRRIFRDRNRGMTQAAIAAGLNADSIPSPTGKRWHQVVIGYILDNVRYRGASEHLFTWSGTEQHVLQEGTHAPIIAPV